MLKSSLSKLRCPKAGKKNQPCGSTLVLTPKETIQIGSSLEIRSGQLTCSQCRAQFPILAGVALLVSDVRDYLLAHVKGISKVVSDAEIPREFLSEFLEAKEEIQVEHIEEDLEAERVVSLYLMNHYLKVSQADPQRQWWSPDSGLGSPLIDELVRKYWDHGPFSWIQERIQRMNQDDPNAFIVELGCGVGGLCRELSRENQSYLGVDSSFASIALARHLALGVSYSGKIRIPKDLLQGSVSFDPGILPAEELNGQADFVVGDLEFLPVEDGNANLVIALNAIDMLDEPSLLPKTQNRLLKRGGVAIQSCPYIWHETVSRKLRARLPRSIRDSARAVEWLYEQEGLRIDEKTDHLPWLFLKHLRQLEIYSVHIFMAKKN